MLLNDLQLMGQFPSERHLMAAREKLTDLWIDAMPAEDLAGLKEMVALEHERQWKPAGDMIRKGDVKTSRAIRAKIFELMPSSAVTMLQQQGGGR